MFAVISFALLCFSLVYLPGCARAQQPQQQQSPPAATTGAADEYRNERRQMVEQQLRPRGIANGAVLEAMKKVARHRFVPAAQEHLAYRDHPLPIGHKQTISQPYIVAYMTEAAGVSRHQKVLEIGTGSGYQAAILGELAKEVYTIEIIPELAERARRTLGALGYQNVYVKTGNGYEGWAEHAPYDAIVVTAAPDKIPPALINQLALGGRMVIPVGTGIQEMVVVTKTRDGIIEKRTIPVRFVPMTGKPN